MGIKLSDMGCLTFSQKKSCGKDKTKEKALFTKLSTMEVNKKILHDVKHKAEQRKEFAGQRREAIAKTKTGKGNK